MITVSKGSLGAAILAAAMGADYGDEIDLVLSRKINENWSVTGKLANFDGDPGFADRTKFWIQTTFTF